MFSVTVLNNRETTCGFWALDMGPLWLKTWISKFYIIVCIVKAMVFPVQSNTGNQKPDSSECHIGIFTSSGVELFHTDQTSQSYRIATPSIHWKDPCWSSDTLATWREELTQWERPDAGKTEGKRGDRGWRGRLDSITDSCMHMNWSKLQEIVEDRAAWCAAVQGVTKSWTQLSNWTAT